MLLFCCKSALQLRIKERNNFRVQSSGCRIKNDEHRKHESTNLKSVNLQFAHLLICNPFLRYSHTRKNYYQMSVSDIIFLLLSIVLDILATRRLLRVPTLSRRVKRIHIVLTWCIPIIWAVLVLTFSTKPPKKTGVFGRGRYMSTGYPRPTGAGR